MFVCIYIHIHTYAHKRTYVMYRWMQRYTTLRNILRKNLKASRADTHTHTYTYTHTHTHIHIHIHTPSCAGIKHINIDLHIRIYTHTQIHAHAQNHMANPTSQISKATS
jgi:hypothetical protein